MVPLPSSATASGSKRPSVLPNQKQPFRKRPLHDGVAPRPSGSALEDKRTSSSSSAPLKSSPDAHRHTPSVSQPASCPLCGIDLPASKRGLAQAHAHQGESMGTPGRALSEGDIPEWTSGSAALGEAPSSLSLGVESGRDQPQQLGKDQTSNPPLSLPPKSLAARGMRWMSLNAAAERDRVPASQGEAPVEKASSMQQIIHIIGPLKRDRCDADNAEAAEAGEKDKK